MFHSIRWRLALPYIALLILTTLFLGIYSSGVLRQVLQDSENYALIHQARLVAGLVSPLVEDPASAREIDPVIRRYADSLGVRITVVSNDGTVLGESQHDPEEMENHLGRPEIHTAFAEGEGYSTRYSTTLGKEMLYAATVIKKDGQPFGVVRLAVALADFKSRLENITGTFALVTGIAALLMLLLATFITVRTLRPLSQITAAAQKIADGSFSGTLIPAARGEVGRLSEAFNNMAVQLRLKITDLQTERGRLEAVLSHMNDGVFIVNEEGVVQLINVAAARMFRIDEREATGHTLVEVVRQHQLHDLWVSSHKSKEQQAALLEFPASRLFLQVIAIPLDDALAGSTLLVFQDLTRQRRLETIRQDFISNVSHELRTPLASLKALTETLHDGALEDPPAASRFLERMEVEIDTLAQMVQELLELSRIESGKVPLDMRPISPGDLIAPAVERMRLQAERAGLTLQMECSETMPRVMADAERMGQVLVNLIHNAIKFTEPGGKIDVTARVSGGKVIFAVQDTGTGIPPDDLPRIFERFYKADRARSGGGTGLGLSIARHMVEAHGGNIWAESQPGQGSTFYISLRAI